MSKLLGVTLVAGLVGAAHAAPITAFTPSETIDLSTDAPYTFELLASDPVPLTGVALAFSFGSRAQGQDILIEITGFESPLYVGKLNELPTSFTLGSNYIDALNQDGKLSVSLTKTAGGGEFEFFGSTLNGPVGSDPSEINQVPEPGTLALLGIGVLGGVLARRRRV